MSQEKYKDPPKTEINTLTPNYQALESNNNKHNFV
jgi:hypothetical protein